jgi:hypothetical protein
MSDQSEPEKGSDFAAQAAERDGGGLVLEFWEFLKDNKKWWLAPIIISVLGLGALVLLGGTAAAPFIYTLF